MAAYVWEGYGETGSVEDPANFNPVGVPGAGDTVTIGESYGWYPDSGTSEAAWTFGGGVGIYGGTFNGPVIIEFVFDVYRDAIFNGPIYLNSGVYDGTYNGDVTLGPSGEFFGGIVNGDVDGRFEGYITGGTFNGDVTIPFYNILAKAEFNGRLRFSTDSEWLHGPLSPDLAAPEDVRLGVTNLGVPGTLEVSGGYPGGVSSDAGLHGGQIGQTTSDAGLHGG